MPDPLPLDGSKILLVINELRWFFTHRISLARAARASGARVGVVAPSGPLGRRIEEEGFAYYPVEIPRNVRNLAAEANALLALTRVYRSVRPDLVHHVTTKPVLYGGYASRLARVPAVVNTVAGLGYIFMSNEARARALRPAVRAAYRFALAHPNSTTIFQNDVDHQSFVEDGLVTPQRAALVRGSGVDIERFQPTTEPDGVPVVLLASRLLWDKGVGDFVEAARLLHARGVACRFVLVGAPDEGNPTSISMQELEAWQAQGLIEWWGEHTDMPGVLAQSNLVVLPSYREGLPKVLLEAAATSRAIVTNDVPGCRDVVQNGRTGLLVPPRDQAALADAIERLVGDPVTRSRMGASGRKRVEDCFAQEIVLRQILEIYTRLLGRRDVGER